MITDGTSGSIADAFALTGGRNNGGFRRCCQEISLRNTSDQPILLNNGTLKIGRPTFGR